MKLLLILAYFLMPKFDMALSSYGLFAAFNNPSDPTHAKAMQTYSNKALLVRGWYGGVCSHSSKTIILELSPTAKHAGVSYVMAELGSIIPFVHAHKKWGDAVTFLCRGNGFETEYDKDTGNRVTQPLLTDCVLINNGGVAQ